MLTLNFLNVNEKGTTAAERLCVIEKPVELNQPIYYKDVLISEWKLVKVLCWKFRFVYISIGKEKLRIPSKLLRIRIQ